MHFSGYDDSTMIDVDNDTIIFISENATHMTLLRMYSKFQNVLKIVSSTTSSILFLVFLKIILQCKSASALDKIQVKPLKYAIQG